MDNYGSFVCLVIQPSAPGSVIYEVDLGYVIEGVDSAMKPTRLQTAIVMAWFVLLTGCGDGGGGGSGLPTQPESTPILVVGRSLSSTDRLPGAAAGRIEYRDLSGEWLVAGVVGSDSRFEAELPYGKCGDAVGTEALVQRARETPDPSQRRTGDDLGVDRWLLSILSGGYPSDGGRLYSQSRQAQGGVIS